MKSFLFIFFFLLSSCVPNIHFNNLFEANPGFFLHYLALLEDVTPPEINFSVPSNYETEISRNRSILVVYDEPILASSVTSDTIKVYAGNEEVKGSIKTSKNSLSFKPETYFLANTKHRVKVQNTVRDLSGNVKPVLQEETLEFTTGNDIDTTSPAFKESTPSTGATDVATNSGINLVFTEVLDPQTVTDENMVLKQGDSIVEKTITYYGSVVQIKPTSSEGMQSFTTYQININTGIKDLAGNALASAQTISFTTNDTSDKTPPAVESTIPSDTAVDISNNTPIIFNLSETPDVTSIKNGVLMVEELASETVALPVMGSTTLEGKSLVFKPKKSFTTERKHRVTLTNSLTDMAGNALAESKVITFTTARLVTYTIGGSISGLSGTLVLQNNAGDDLSLTSAGTFTFSTAVANSYSVTVKTQPTGQTCTVTNGNGAATANVTGVSVSCATSTFSISGNLSGMGSGKNIILQLNSGNDLTLSANGSFTFGTSINYDSSYTVTVKTNPSTQTCTVLGGTGSAIGNVNNIIISCDPYMEPKTWYVDNGDGTVYDKSTGLTWMKCSMSNNPGVPRTGDDCSVGTIGLYKYCGEADSDCNGGTTSGTYGTLITSGFSGTYSGSYGTVYNTGVWNHYIAYKACNDANTTPTGGFTGRVDWRLPSLIELESLIDLSGNNYPAVSNAKINGNFFPDTLAYYYWSSSAFRGHNSLAMTVVFHFGGISSISKATSFYVRCVSGP
ncbi:MAG: Ig-like domain-containing protein [Leptospiraceae bacterium]|nr:Ig-like domain-containing protein [Leptospiraceae bacterium]